MEVSLGIGVSPFIFPKYFHIQVYITEQEQRTWGAAHFNIDKYRLSLTCSDRLSTKPQYVASPLGTLLNSVHQDGTRTTRCRSKDSLRSRTHKRLIPRPGIELSRAWVRDYLSSERGSAPLTSITNSLFDSTQNGVYSGRAGLRSLRRSVHASLSSAVGKNVHFAQKTHSSVQRHETHKLSDLLHRNYSVWAITPLCFSLPTFINFLLVVTSLMWEKIPGSPHVSVLQATESWLGPGNKARLFQPFTSGSLTAG